MGLKRKNRNRQDKIYICQYCRQPFTGWNSLQTNCKSIQCLTESREAQRLKRNALNLKSYYKKYKTLKTDYDLSAIKQFCKLSNQVKQIKDKPIEIIDLNKLQNIKRIIRNDT